MFPQVGRGLVQIPRVRRHRRTVETSPYSAVTS
jgi:hypothetical protein